MGTMESETVDPIDWSHPPPSWALVRGSELHVLHGVKAAYKSQDLLQQPGLETIGYARVACAATKGETTPLINTFLFRKRGHRDREMSYSNTNYMS